MTVYIRGVGDSHVKTFLVLWLVLGLRKLQKNPAVPLNHFRTQSILVNFSTLYGKRSLESSTYTHEIKQRKMYFCIIYSQTAVKPTSYMMHIIPHGIQIAMDSYIVLSSRCFLIKNQHDTNFYYFLQHNMQILTLALSLFSVEDLARRLTLGKQTDLILLDFSKA